MSDDQDRMTIPHAVDFRGAHASRVSCPASCRAQDSATEPVGGAPTFTREARVLPGGRIPCCSSFTGSGGMGVCKTAGGFTILEVLVASAVLALLLALTLQILGNTNAAIRTADRQMDAASRARAVLDRFDTDFSGAMLTQGASAICRVATSTNAPAIGFVCRARARESGSSTVPSWQANLRGAIVGYRMNGRALERGDGRFPFTGENVGDHVASDFPVVFGNLAKDLALEGEFLVWNPMGEGVVRFHVSYQLDDGTITQTPPEYTMTSPQTGDAVSFLNGADILPCRAVAFDAQHAPESGTLQGRYVRALIVGVATLDRTTLTLASEHLEDLDDLGTPGVSPSADTDTPLVLWEKNLSDVSFLPLRQGLRFYQRVIPVP